MGQKVNPLGLRLGIIGGWISRWYEEKDYAQRLHEDIKIRRFLTEKFEKASVSKILIERAVNKIRINIFAARPGIIIGRKGETIEKTKKDLEKLIKSGNIFLNVQEVSQPELDAKLVAENIAFQLKRKTPAKRAMREAISRIMGFGAQGVRIACQGRIGGAEIARKEWTKEGRVPLHTLRADIDYATATAHTTYGCIGIKVWIYKGEVLSTLSQGEFKNETPAEKS